MRRHTFAVVIGLSGLLGGFWVTACSVDTNGAAPEPSEASIDGSVVADSTAPPDAMTPESDVVGTEPKEAEPDVETSVTEAGPQAECNASNCNGACCGTHCVSKTCAGCNLGTLFCPFSTTVVNSNGTCVSSCASCNTLGVNAGVACFSCASGPATGTCAATAAQCPAGLNTGACPCTSTDAGSCPGTTQVCVVPQPSDGGDEGGVGTCLTCGQVGTQGLSCQSGACSQNSSACNP
jgi:hypothetical protein